MNLSNPAPAPLVHVAFDPGASPRSLPFDLVDDNLAVLLDVDDARAPYDPLVRLLAAASGGKTVRSRTTYLPSKTLTTLAVKSKDGVKEHREWMKRVPELGADLILESRPVGSGRRFNEGFAWSETGVVASHRKRYSQTSLDSTRRPGMAGARGGSPPSRQGAGRRGS